MCPSNPTHAERAVARRKPSNVIGGQRRINLDQNKELIMPNRSTHLVVGTTAGVAAYFITKLIPDEPFTFKGLTGSALAVAFFGLLPDLIEPAIHPNHRAFAHSFTMSGMLLGSNLITWKSPNFPIGVKFMITICSSAYLSHLMADARTPKGLPIF